MIELTVDAAGLARSRFVVSPLHEVAATLLPWGLRRDPEADPWVTRARRVLRRAGLPLLSELALDGGGYLPDFLSPHPSGPSPTVEEELDRVRATPPGRVLDELQALRNGRPRNGLAGAELPPGVRRAMTRGGGHVARQAAEELRRYWELAFAPHWPDAKAALDAEVDRCAGVLARQGAAGLFNSLHPGIRWAGGTLRVDSRFTVAIPVPLVIVLPSLVATEPHGGRGPGARRTAAADGGLSRAGPARRTGAPVGRAGRAARSHPGGARRWRGRLSTTQLAARHFLSAATVSYHLGVLHRAGLVTRARSGRTVLYRRTPAGSRLTGRN